MKWINGASRILMRMSWLGTVALICSRQTFFLLRMHSQAWRWLYNLNSDGSNMRKPLRKNGVVFTYRGYNVPDCMNDVPVFSEPTKWCMANVGQWNKGWNRTIVINENSSHDITYYFEDSDLALLFKLAMHDLKYETTVTK